MIQDLTRSFQSRETPLHIGVIASMKRGLEQFIYRELQHMEAVGTQITLCPTKIGDGLYSPLVSWKVVYWTMFKIVVAQPGVFLRSPKRYLRGLSQAIRFRALADFLLAAFFSKELGKVDAIYSTFGDRKLFVGYFASRLLSKPLMCTIHAYELYDNPNPEMFEVALHACDQVITISEYNRNVLDQQFGYDPAQVEVIRCSINLQEYEPGERFVILIVGFFVQRKGHRVLFEALKQLDNPNLEVWVVGGEGAESTSVDVRKLSVEYGLESQVAFFGKLSGTALRSVYRSCDVFCLPCHFDEGGVGEGFPVVIIEAMALGKPVISSRHVGIPEILNELLIDEQDVQGLASAIDQLYRSKEMGQRLGRQNRALAEEHFAPGNAERTAGIARRLAFPEDESSESIVPGRVDASREPSTKEVIVDEV